jgi:hypothetical protein
MVAPVPKIMDSSGVIHNLYSSPGIINYKVEEMMWSGHVAWKGEKRNVYKLLVLKPEGKRPLGRPRRRWMDNIKMYEYLLEIGLNVVDWIGLAQDRYRWRESSCKLGNEPSGSIKCWESTEWLHNLWPLERNSAPQI